MWLCYRSGREVSLFHLLKVDGQTSGLQLDTDTSRSWSGARTESAFLCYLDWYIQSVPSLDGCEEISETLRTAPVVHQALQAITVLQRHCHCRSHCGKLLLVKARQADEVGWRLLLRL